MIRFAAERLMLEDCQDYGEPPSLAVLIDRSRKQVLHADDIERLRDALTEFLAERGRVVA